MPDRPRGPTQDFIAEYKLVGVQTSFSARALGYAVSKLFEIRLRVHVLACHPAQHLRATHSHTAVAALSLSRSLWLYVYSMYV